MTQPKVKSAGTGAVNRGLSNKVFDMISSSDFGGVTDGVTDSTAYINSAVAYLVTLGSGIVLIPPKTVYVEANLVLNSNVLILDFSTPGTFTILTKDEGNTLPITKGGIKIKSQGKDGVLLRAHDAGIAGNPFVSINNSVTGQLAGLLVSFLSLTEGQNYIDVKEIATPNAPGANIARLFTKDNGSGKTQLCVRFNTGAVQVISTEP